MTGRREQMRAADMADPARSAQSFTEILQRIQRRLEALERSLFVDLKVTSDGGGTMPPIVIAAPKWPVRAVYLAKIYDITNGTTVFLAETLEWLVNDDGISIPAMYMPSVNTQYAVTFEVRG